MGKSFGMLGYALYSYSYDDSSNYIKLLLKQIIPLVHHIMFIWLIVCDIALYYGMFDYSYQYVILMVYYDIA